MLDGVTEKVSVYALIHSQYMQPFKLTHLTDQGERTRPASVASGSKILLKPIVSPYFDAPSAMLSASLQCQTDHAR